MRKINIENIKEPNRFLSKSLLTKKEVETSIERAISIIEKNIDKYGDDFPAPATKNNQYEIIDNIEWTNGFWTGMLWLAYEYTKNDKFKKAAEKNVQSFKERVDKGVELDHHDLGFLYSLSCVSAYKVVGSEVGKEAALKAAERLTGRYQEKGQFIQAWGQLGAKDNYRLIIDCLLNIPLLYWANEQTGDEKYYNIAYNHYKTACGCVIREDASTHHTYYFDPETGKPIKGVTRQGYSDTSSWARGQAWGVYGIPLTYKYVKDIEAVDLYKSVLNYFLNRLPKDNVCYWDLIFKDEDNQSRDSSAAAIAVCGIHEMNKYLPETEENKEVYKYAMHTILRSLMENYTPKEDQNSDAILLHGVYSWHSGKGVDEGNIWGDYYYLEALIRFYKDWELYW